MEHINPVYEEVEVLSTHNNIQLQKNDCYESVEKSCNNSIMSKISVVERRSNKKAVVVIGMIFAIQLLLLGAVAANAIYTVNEISKIKSEISATNEAVLQQSSVSSIMLERAQMNVSLELMLYQQLVRDLEVRFQQLQSFSNSTAGMISTLHQQLAQNDTTLDSRFTSFLNSSNTALEQLNESISIVVSALVGVISMYPVPSCNDLPPFLPAGYYYILSSNGSAVRQYCPSITTRCGQTGRWRSVANLDMTNSTHQCFSGLRQHLYFNKRLCVKRSYNIGCSSDKLSTTSAYTSICAFVRAYQFGSTDAFRAYNDYGGSIDSAYVDGVSITHGSPRQHIWTFAATRTEISGHSGCPCMGGSNDRPSFVGNDYFCDTGTSTGTEFVWYGDDPLWDGAGCGPTNNCCSFNTPPLFYKELPQYTYDSIELRLCRDQGRHDEDIGLEAVTIYVK